MPAVMLKYVLFLAFFMVESSVLAELRASEASLNASQRKLYEFVVTHWPTSPLEIAEHFHENIATREGQKRASTKYSYHLRKLVDKRLLLCKKSGNSLMYWPLLVEKYRVIHSILME